jgi:hypothetical protein
MPISPSSSTAHLAGLGMTIAISNPNIISDSAAATGIPNLTTGQRKRIKAYLKRCRLNPRHAQLNLEGYLLLPVQRIPRYKLMVCNFSFFAHIYSYSIYSSKSSYGAHLLPMSIWMILWIAHWRR